MEAILGLFCFLIGMAIVLAFIAVLGHGLWTMAATVFGSRSSSKPRETRRRFHTCVGCGEEFALDADDSCPACGLEPNGRVAAELKDLEAAARTVDRLQEIGSLSPETCERIHHSIEARQETLLPGRRKSRELDPVEQLEEWFGSGQDMALTVDEKKQALAQVRLVPPARLRDLSPVALVGLARLQTSVGMLSRACQLYRVLLQHHPDAPITSRTAVEAIQTARKLDDRHVVDNLIEIVSTNPDLVARDPELAMLVRQVRTHDVTPLPVAQVALPVAVPAAVIIEEPPAPVAAPIFALVDEPADAVVLASVESSATGPVSGPALPTEPTAPRRSIGEWFAGFMEEKNILWGELIGGTLIVGCSIALVISLWQTFELEQIPFFPFLILAAITSALFGAGFYTLHHWKLESTSRGLLLIGTLLVPLDFLVLAGLTPADAVGWLDYLTAIASLAVFGWFLYRAARILVQIPLDVPMPSALVVALTMLVSAAVQLVAPMVLLNDAWQPASVYALTLIPVLAYVAGLAWLLYRLNAVKPWSVGRRAALLIALGVVTFACCVTLSFPVYRADVLAQVLPTLSPALTLLGIPILLAGTLLHRNIASEGEESHGLWRTVGTGLALAGVFVMFGGFAVSVTDPVLRWLAGGINIATLLAVACVLRVPMLHVAVQLYCAALVVYGWTFDVNELMREPVVALRLVALLVVQAIAAEVLTRWHRRLDAQYYGVGCAVTTVLAGLLALRFAATHPDINALVLGIATVTWIIANLRWRSPAITYASAIVLAPTIFFALRHFHDAPIAEQILWSLLTHGTLCVIAGTALRSASADWLRECYRVPLQFTGMCATFFAAAVVLGEQFPATLSWPASCAACAWLAALWLVLSALEGWPALFAGFQAALAAAWIFGAGGLLTEHGWDWREPYSLHVYAVGLGVLGLIAEITRVAALSKPRIQSLLAPPFVPIDRITTGLLVVGQYVLVLAVVSWSIGKELSATPDAWRVLPIAWHEHAYSAWAWLTPIVLAVVLVLWLRDLDLMLPTIGFTILLLTLPVLLAGASFDETLATASAARWGLALCYGIGSLLLWQRYRLGADRVEHVPTVAIRGLLFVGAVLPVLYITFNVTAAKLFGRNLAGPVAESIFVAMTGPTSLLVPLALLTAALAGHGFRERLAYYVYGAGLLANASGVGAFFLGLRMRDIEIGPSWIFVYALLVSAGVAWVWSLLWTWVASMLEHDEPRPLLDSPLWAVNSLFGTAMFGIVLLTALNWIMFGNGEGGKIWTDATGSHWTWLVFGLMAGGAILHFWSRRGSVPLHLLGELSLTAVGLAACTIERMSSGDGVVALMFLSSVYACAWVWSNLFLDWRQPPSWLTITEDIWESVLYAALAGAVAVVLGCATLVTDQLAVWSAESIGLTALACGLLAYQRKTEIWSVAASLLLMLTGTILVLHFDPDNANVALLTIQVHVAILGATAVAKLALHDWLAPAGVGIARLRLLPVQIAIGMFANFVLLAIGLSALVFTPDLPGDWLTLQANWTGWLALATNVIALVWFVGVVKPRFVVHDVAIAGLMLGVILAGAIDSAFDPQIAWLGHHVLTLAWTVSALLLLVASWASHASALLGSQSWLAESLRRYFPERDTRGWVTLFGAFVVVLALRAAWVEPASPYWAVGNTFAVAVLLGALAVWSRSPVYVYGSGLLANVIGLILFTAWSVARFNVPGPMLANDEWTSFFVLTQVLSFGAAAIVWSLLERTFLDKKVELSQGVTLPFTQFAVHAGIHLLAIGVVFANGLHLVGEEVRIGTWLTWESLGFMAAAALVELWRPAQQRSTRYQIYTCGLLAIGLLLHELSLAIPDWYWTATLLLAGYVLLIVVLYRLAHAIPLLREKLQLDAKPDPDGRWFWHVQLGTVALVVGLSVWITLTFATWQDRLGGAVACALATAAVFLLVPKWSRVFGVEEDSASQSVLPRYLVLTLGVAVALHSCWALLDPSVSAIWLHRYALALTVTTAAMLAFRFGLPRWPAASTWATPGRALGAWLGVICAAILLIVIGQELIAYDPVLRSAPLRKDFVVFSAIAILALAATAVWSALTKEADLYGIENERRSLYVYLAEMLAAAFFAHLRLNVPDMFSQAIGRHWYFVVMVLAFAWLALSEICKRQSLTVFVTPLKRTAIFLAFVPVLAFRLAPLVLAFEALDQHVPGLAPFFRYLKTLSQNTLLNLPAEALCWLLLGIFFGALARLHKSANLGIAAALAINAGVWVFLSHQDATTFLQRPQLWLIPLGLIILVAEFINREQLGFWPSLSVRYVGLMCIYLSSTIEMFSADLRETVILPIVLVLLAVAGMLLGILFRVRAFVLSGFMALLLVVFTQIWNAAVLHSHTWVWWACGIILGVIILAMFAVFEKHRNEVLKVLDNMKRWN